MNRLFYLFFIVLYPINLLAQNVGIGTINPLNRLHVSTNGSNVLLIENTQLLNTDTTTGLFFKTGNGSYPYTGAIKNIGQNSIESRLGLFTYASSISSGLLERLSLLDNGNVGIGTTTPGAKLEVAGGVKISDSINIGGQVRIMSGTPGAGKVLTSDATGLASWATLTPPSQTAVFLPTTVIGTQQWMSKNLDVAFYKNGDPIPQVTDATAWAGLTTGAWCYYNNDSTQGTTYGKLYNWFAVNDPRGLAPTGWHIPSDAEWTALSTTLGGDAVSGGKMKEAGTPHWTSPNTGGNNNSGFAGLPGGGRYSFGLFSNVSGFGLWWSATESTTTVAWYRTLMYSFGSIDWNNNNKRYGFSVRCLRD